jgi:hypothetical protein
MLGLLVIAGDVEYIELYYMMTFITDVSVFNIFLIPVEAQHRKIYYFNVFNKL